MLGGIMLYEIIALLQQRNLAEYKIKNLQQAIMGNIAQRLFFGYLFITLITSAFFITTNIKNTLTVSASEQNAAEWIRLNTPKSATIATITEAHPLADPFTEWLPALTQRKIVTSAFGYEWLNASKSFQNRLTVYRILQNCAQEPPACLEDWMAEHGRVGYLVLRLGNTSQTKDMPLRIWMMTTHPDYTQIYYKENIAIFRINHD
jgi:hypothetical protein